jgi:uncharacterized protein YjbK
MKQTKTIELKTNMTKRELNYILMDSFEVAEKFFKNGNHYSDMTLKQRREVLKEYHGYDLYYKLSTMNLGPTSAAARIMMMNMTGKVLLD